MTLCGGDEDANAGGDLDYTGTQALTLTGHGSVIEQTCAGERVLDQLDSTPQVDVSDVTITGGNNTGGAAIRFNSDVELTGVTVSGNDAGTGAVLDSGEIGGGADIALVDSTLGPNTGTGIRISFGGISVDGSTITQNTGRGIGAVDGAVSVVDSAINDNGQGGVSTTGQGDGVLTFTNSVRGRQRRVGRGLLRMRRPRDHRFHDHRECALWIDRRWRHRVERRPGRARRGADGHDHRHDGRRQHAQRPRRWNGRLDHRADR